MNKESLHSLLRWTWRSPGYCASLVAGGIKGPGQRALHRILFLPSVGRILSLDAGRLASTLSELLQSPFYAHMQRRRRELPFLGYFRAPEALYLIVRTKRPSYVVETGAGVGWASAFILHALRVNREGKLYSVDLPNRGGWYSSRGFEVGFLVPEALRADWEIRLGNSKEILPRLLDELGTIDIFHHDSLHTYDHMTFEFRTSWEHLGKGGLLLSDDVFWNDAFLDFAESVGRTPQLVYHYGGSSPFGALRK